MAPNRYADSSVDTGWKIWRPPALRGIGWWTAYVRRTGAVLTRSMRDGRVLAAQWVTFQAPDAAGQIVELLDVSEVMMKRRAKVTAGVAVTPHADAVELLERWPTLGGWMTDPAYDDGSERKGGWFCVSCRDGLWTALMKDDGEALQISLSAPSPLHLLDLMEHALTSPEAPWRHFTPAYQAKKKGK